MLPNFVIIGAMKGGTTSLYQYMRDHPDIFMPTPKEINFFNRYWESGRHWYEGHFEGSAGATAVGEASPNYTKAHHWPDTARRMASLIPDARLIYVLREPVERMRSHYQHHVVAGQESRSIERALREVADPNTNDYHNTSRYGSQLETYLDHFAPEQILVITSDLLRYERQEALREVFRFVRVDEQWIPPNIEQLAHRTAKKIVFRPAAARIRSHKKYRALADRVPLAVKQKVHRLWAAPVADVVLSPALREYLREVVLDHDLGRLRTLVDLPEIRSW